MRYLTNSCQVLNKASFRYLVSTLNLWCGPWMLSCSSEQSRECWKFLTWGVGYYQWKFSPPPPMRLGLGVDMYPYLCWGFDDNPGTNNIDMCRDCIQTSDVFLQVCLSSFWLAGSGRMRILSLCTKGPWWSLIRLSKFLLMERNCSTCLQTWSGIASS